MAKITIRDLEQNEQLDRQAVAKVLGGRPGERAGPALGTQLLRQRAASAGLVPAIYDPAWRLDGDL